MRSAVTSLIELDALAGTFLAEHPRGGVFGLVGPLGVGKTAFVRSIIRHICQREGEAMPRVVSPSYVLHQHYALNPSVDHFDLYRLNAQTPESLLEMGYYEAVENAERVNGYVFVEWPERLPAALPWVRVQLEFNGEARWVSWER